MKAPARDWLRGNPGIARRWRRLPRVAAATLQNTPTSLLRTISRRSTCTQRSITMWSIRPISPAASAIGDEIVGGENLILVVAQPRHRLVEAHLALRQRHHRLQIDIDPVFLDGALHRAENLRLAARGRWQSRPRRTGAASARVVFGGERQLLLLVVVRPADRRVSWRSPRQLPRPRPACRHGRRRRPRAA